MDIPIRSSACSEIGSLEGISGDGSHNASVEFRGVYFHYPEQPAEKGLKDVSFRVAAGTTTAVVGHTGAGTCVLLYFRPITLHFHFHN